MKEKCFESRTHLLANGERVYSLDRKDLHITGDRHHQFLTEGEHFSDTNKMGATLELKSAEETRRPQLKAPPDESIWSCTSGRLALARRWSGWNNASAAFLHPSPSPHPRLSPWPCPQ